MYDVILTFFILISICLIIFIMLQNNGTDNICSNVGVNQFGSLFNSNGFWNFITYITVILITLFFALSLTLGNLNIHNKKNIIKCNNFDKQEIDSNKFDYRENI